MTIDCQVCGKPTDAHLCWDCTDTTARRVRALPTLIVALTDAMARQVNVYRAARRVPVEREDWVEGDYALRPTAMPVDLHASELRQDTIYAWQSSRWIASDQGKRRLRIHERAGEIAENVRRAHRAAERAVDRSPSAFFAGPCSAQTTETITEVRDGTEYITVITGPCDRDLYAWPGKDRIVCDGFNTDGRGCGAEHSFTDREQQLVDSIEDALLPLELLRAVTKRHEGKRPLLDLRWPPAATVRSWRFRQRLDVRSVDRQGRELFRGGDVLDLVRDWNRKLSAPARTIAS